jgi:hypothetical protein
VDVVTASSAAKTTHVAFMGSPYRAHLGAASGKDSSKIGAVSTRDPTVIDPSGAPAR